jgi:hypothetical protein
MGTSTSARLFAPTPLLALAGALFPLAAAAWVLVGALGGRGWAAAAAAAVLLAGGLRIAYAWFVLVPIRADALDYVELAGDFAGWLADGAADRSPLYAGLVASLLHGANDGQRVGVGQGLIEAGAALALVACGVAVGRVGVGVLAAWAHALNPSAIETAHQVLTESSAGAAGAAALACALYAARGSRLAAALAGLAVGVSTLIRVNHLLWAAALAAAILLAGAAPPRRRLVAGALMLGVAALTVSPLLYRNWVLYRAFPVLSSVAGINQSKGSGLPYQGAHARATTHSAAPPSHTPPGYGIMVVAGPGCDTQLATYQLLMDSPEVRGVTASEPRAREIAVDRALGAAATRKLREDLAARPLQVAGAWLTKAADQWLYAYQPQFCYGAPPLVGVVLADAYHHLLLGLAALGALLLWLCGGAPRLLALALVALAAANTIPTLLTLGLPRYTAPLLPALALAAGAGLAFIGATIRRASTP